METVFLASSFVEVLQKVIGTIFSTVFAPIMADILQVFAEYATSVIWSMMSEWLLAFLVILCSIVDFVENMFNVFAGISPVEVNGQQTYLLDAFFQMKDVTRAFAIITVLAVAISFIFTVYKTAKSIADMTLEDKNPISKVLADGMKAAVTFLLIPFLCIFLLQLSSLVTNQAINAFDAAQGGSTTMGTIIFLSAGLDADKATTGRRDAISGEMEELVEGRTPSFTDDVRKPYLEGTKDYRDVIQVKKEFHAANFNFFVGFASGVVMLFILMGSIMIFIRRLFELLLLYLVSPLFVSTIPLDDGAIFSKWRELFVAKFFSGFGVIFAMRYYLMLVPTIAGTKLCLYPMELPNASIINTILKMFLIIGGAWAVYKSQSLILQVLNQEAAMAEQQAGALVQGMIIGAVSTAGTIASAAASGGTTAAVGGLGKVGQMAGAAAGGGDDKGGDKGDDKQRFKG